VIRIEERIRHYLLISLTLAFITGLSLQGGFPFTPIISTCLAFLCLVATLYYQTNKNHIPALSFLLLTVFFLGNLYLANFEKKHLHTSHISSHITQEEDVVLTGTLQRMPLFDGERTTVIIKSHSLRLQHADDFSVTSGLVRLRLKGTWPESLRPGDEIVIRTKLSRPYGFGNPGAFDYPDFLASKNIRVIGRINSTTHILPLQQSQSWLHVLQYLPENIRLSVRNLINNTLEPKEAGVYRALLIGDRSGLSQDTLEGFKASGTMHILAISGLHLSLVASLLFLIFYYAATRSQYLLLRISCKKLALFSSIIPLCFYALLAGAQTPVLRSLIMVLVFIVAFAVRRQGTPFSTLSIAALIILLLNPQSLFTVSFQLSFVAVASLILVLPQLLSLVQKEDQTDRPRLQRYTAHIWRWIRVALLVSVAATIGTIPLLLQSFNRIAVAGPVANLLLEPLLCLWSLPFGLLAIVVHFFDLQSSSHILQIGALGIKASLLLTDTIKNYPYSTVWLATPPVLLIASYYGSLGLLFSRISRRKSIPLFLGICLLFIFPLQNFRDSLLSSTEIVFLDVGQGSSTLVNFPGGNRVLIDGGGASSAKFNVGESVIARYLWQKGITDIDAVAITHPDADHYNGIPFILKRFHPDTLWINGSSGHDQEYSELLELAKQLGIEIKTPTGQEILMEARGQKLVNISNPFLNDVFNSATAISSNEQSLILQVKGESFSCLLPGDISTKVENVLVAQHANLHSSILLAPHHGSKTSNSEAFLASIQPEYIVVSAGRFRPLLFPSTKLRSYAAKRTIPLLVTAEKGAITFRETGGAMEYSCFNQRFNKK